MKRIIKMSITDPQYHKSNEWRVFVAQDYEQMELYASMFETDGCYVEVEVYYE